jgi:hypothetical protein
MEQPSNSVSGSRVSAKPSYDVRSLLVTVCIVIGIIIAIYAITVNPNDATLAIGFPP